jgi:6-phosphogluconate dehydrogenase
MDAPGREHDGEARERAGGVTAEHAADGVSDVAMVGLGVMGRNLVLNLSDHGLAVSVHDRDRRVVRDFLGGEASGRAVRGFDDLASLALSLGRPRRVMLMVPAGAPVDAVLDDLVPHLEPGDVVIDGGNSHYADTARRARELRERGLLFVGAGVSGGAEGARVGPAIMPGGDPAAWPLVAGMLQDIAARADGQPCCDWVGEGGAGHYVKMVHNGIEYADMQLIAEAYHYMRVVVGLTVRESAGVFAEWAGSRLDSYLVEITADVLARVDDDGLPLVDKVRDVAGQKGTGRWAAADALERGVPLDLTAAAVFARALSALKDERVAAAQTLRGPGRSGVSFDRLGQLRDLEDALYAAKVVAYAQGFALLRRASDDLGWGVPLSTVPLLWRGGCVIRSRILGDVAAAYAEDPELPDLMTAPRFARELAGCQAGWRRTLTRAIAAGVPMPATSAALAHYDGYRSERLPANLIEAQRDYFGAHGYERVDAPRGERFRTDWTGRGGT